MTKHEQHLRKRRRWRAANLDRARNWQRKYRRKHLERSRESVRQWQLKHPEQRRLLQKRWRVKHAKKLQQRERAKLRCNHSYRLLKNLRGRIYHAMIGTAKTKKTLQLLGCSIESFWLYLESLFKEGMTRENYGAVWEVDHILPCALFDLTRPDHQRRCFHFSNLQPLFAIENRSKRAKLDHEFRRIRK